MQKTKIDLDLLKKVAPTYFSVVLDHLATLKRMAMFTGRYSKVRFQVEQFMRISGMSAADIITEYDDTLLENDEFRIVTMLYACASLISVREIDEDGALNSEDVITIDEFRGSMSILQEVMGGEFSPNDAIRYFSERFDIDPNLIPEYVKKNLTDESEERKANQICEEKIRKLDDHSNYVEFDQYYEYIEENTKSIISTLNTEGLINTYPLDIMAILILLRKLRFQVAKLYDVDNALPMPKEILNALAKKIFHATKNGISGGIIGPDDLGGD